jgi:hypothetical protein
LLLAQPILLTVLFAALPLPEPSLLRPRRPLLFPPLRGAGNRLGQGRWRILPRGLHGHSLLSKAVSAHIDAT